MFRPNILRNCANLTRKIGNYETNSIARLYCTGRLSQNALTAANNCSLKSLTFHNKLQTPLLQAQKMQARNASTAGDHVKIWQLERILSVALLPLLPIALISENAILESILAIGTVMHTHWGLEAIVVDYARPAVVGAVLAKAAHLLLNVFSVITLAGLLVLIFGGPGIGKTLKKGWAIGKGDAKH